MGGFANLGLGCFWVVWVFGLGFGVGVVVCFGLWFGVGFWVFWVFVWVVYGGWFGLDWFGFGWDLGCFEVWGWWFYFGIIFCSYYGVLCLAVVVLVWDGWVLVYAVILGLGLS